MAYTQNLEGCFTKVLPHKEALLRFKEAYKSKSLAPLAKVEQTEDLKVFEQATAKLMGYTDVLILGTGGSSLSGKTICALSTAEKPRLHFLDNIDPTTFSALFKKLDKNKTGILVISKSGSTVETLMQLVVCLEFFGDQGQYLIVTEATNNPLKRLANSHGWPCLEHPMDVGGRYSCFSVVGMLPMILAGLDTRAYRKGGLETLQQALTEDSCPALEAASTALHLGKPMSVMMPYADQLEFFCLWYRQLWAESIGKDGKGTTPIKALGTVDQHSQLQLYLDGPKDKIFTILTTKWDQVGTPIKSQLIPEFTGKTMGDLFAAEQKATYETLVRNSCPTRLITLDKIDEYHLGALMMHFMIETILMSYLLGVNAFDQPAVEEGKRLARKYLAA